MFVNRDFAIFGERAKLARHYQVKIIKIRDICYWRASEESPSTFYMKSREAMVLIFNLTVSREISWTNFTRVLSGK